MVGLQSSQHSSDDHWVLRLEVMRDANGQHLHSDDLALAITGMAARRAVHARIARDEEFRELMHELTRRVCTALHEVRPVWKRAVQFRAARRSEARCAQAVIRGKVTVQLC